LRNLDQRSYTSSVTKPFSSAPTSSFKVRRLETDDVANYRELRLEGLKSHPEAFASSWEHEADKPVSWWADVRCRRFPAARHDARNDESADVGGCDRHRPGWRALAPMPSNRMKSVAL
jgi:hypothetical protein